MKKIIYAGITALLIAGLYSCQKSDQKDVTSGSASTSVLTGTLKAAVSETNAANLAEAGTQDIQSLCIEKYDGLGEAVPVDAGMMHGYGQGKFFKIPHLSECATVTVSDSLYPKIITIDYGTGCVDHHNHTISGKIVISISDSLTSVGAVKTIISQDLKIDSSSVVLNLTYTNSGLNDAGNWVIAKTGSQVITDADGSSTAVAGDETIEWISGFGTTNKDDDKFFKFGSGTITIDDSLIYSRKITTPLYYDKTCEYVLSGVVELYKDGTSVVIDYGDGTCDNLATSTSEGVTTDITIESKGPEGAGKGKGPQGGGGHGGGHHGGH
jgi:hypothetical protein